MPFCGNCGHPLSDTDLTCPELRRNSTKCHSKAGFYQSRTDDPNTRHPNRTKSPSGTERFQRYRSTGRYAVSDNYDHVAAYQNNAQADTPVANDIPREVPQPDTSATQNTTAETNAAPDFSAYGIRNNNIPNGNTANQQQPNFSGTILSADKHKSIPLHLQ